MDTMAEDVGENHTPTSMSTMNDEKLRVTSTQFTTMNTLLDHWRSAGLVEDEQHTQLVSSVVQVPFNWQFIGRVAAFAAFACFISSVLALVADEWVIEMIMMVVRFLSFANPDIGRGVACSVISGLFLLSAHRYRRKHPQSSLAASILAFVGSVACLTALHFFAIVWVPHLNDSVAALVFGVTMLLHAVTVFPRGACVPVWLGGIAWIIAGAGGVIDRARTAMTLQTAVVSTVVYLVGAWASAACGEAQQNANKRVHSRAHQCCVDVSRVTKLMGGAAFHIAMCILSVTGSYVFSGTIPTPYGRQSMLQRTPWFIMWFVGSVAPIMGSALWHKLSANSSGFVAALCHVWAQSRPKERCGVVLPIVLNIYMRCHELWFDMVHSAVWFGVLGVLFWVVSRHTELSKHKHE